MRSSPSDARITNLIIETNPERIPRVMSTAYSQPGAPHLSTKSHAMAIISAAGRSRVTIACAIIFITYIAPTNLLYTAWALAFMFISG